MGLDSPATNAAGVVHNFVPWPIPCFFLCFWWLHFSIIVWNFPHDSIWWSSYKNDCIWNNYWNAVTRKCKKKHVIDAAQNIEISQMCCYLWNDWI